MEIKTEFNLIDEEIVRLKVKPNSKGQYNRESELPSPWKEIGWDQNKPKLINNIDLLYRYLQVKPDRFKDSELDIIEQSTDNCTERQDIEPVGHSGFLVSEKIKTIFDTYGVPASFFPVLSDGQRWYLMMWQKVSLLGEYEVDVAHTVYETTSYRPEIPPAKSGDSSTNPVYSIGYFDKLNIKTAFTHMPAGHVLYLRELLWRELDKRDIAYSGYKIKVSNFIPNYDDMIQAIKNQQLIMLNDMQYQRYKRSYDYLEQVLLAEGDKDVIEKFNTEIKNKWEDQFIRFANGTLPPDERVWVW